MIQQSDSISLANTIMVYGHFQEVLTLQDQFNLVLHQGNIITSQLQSGSLPKAYFFLQNCRNKAH